MKTFRHVTECSGPAYFKKNIRINPPQIVTRTTQKDSIHSARAAINRDLEIQWLKNYLFRK